MAYPMQSHGVKGRKRYADSDITSRYRAMPTVLAEVLESAQQQSSNDERYRWDEAARAYDNDLVTDELRYYQGLYQMPDLQTAFIKQAVNSVSGNQIKTRTDHIVRADQDDDEETAEALNAELNEAMRMVDAHEVDSRNHLDQLKFGCAWGYVGRNPDPLGYKYVYEAVHRDQMVRDIQAQDDSNRDARFTARRRFFTARRCKALFPEHTRLIDATFENYGQWDIMPSLHTSAGESWGAGVSELINETGGIKHVAVYEVYWREHEKRTVIRYGDVVELFDEERIDHITMIVDRTASTRQEWIGVMKQAWFIGPYMVEMGDSPHPHNECPYILLPGYREDKTGHLVGVVNDMISPMKAYNSAKARIHHILNSKMIVYEEAAFPPDAKMTKSKIETEANRKDPIFVLAAGYNGRFEITSDWAELDRLVTILQMSEEEIHKASGINLTFAGKNQENKSGVAIANLAELSAAGLGQITSKFGEYRRRVGRQVMAHIRADIGQTQKLVSIAQQDGLSKKQVTLNERQRGGGINNDLQRARLSVVLDDISSSQGYKEHNFQRIMEMYQATPPGEAQLLMFRMAVDSSSMPNKSMYLKQIDAMMKKMGISTGLDDEAEQQAAAQQQQVQQAAMQMEQQKQQAEIAKTQAEAQSKAADAEQTQVETQQLKAQPGIAAGQDAEAELQAGVEAGKAARESQDADDAEKNEAIKMMRRRLAEQQFSQIAA